MPKKFLSKTKRKRRISFNRRSCYFCSGNSGEISFREPALLLRFISPRGKIIARSRSGVCARHQRRLSRAIKIARINAILPFKENIVS